MIAKVTFFTTAPADLDEPTTSDDGPTGTFVESPIRQVTVHADTPTEAELLGAHQASKYAELGFANMTHELLAHTIEIGYTKLHKGRCERCYSIIIGPTITEPETGLKICRQCLPARA